MVHHVHKISAFLFFLLGGSFFIAWLLLKNQIQPLEAAWWLQRGDLPLLAVALLYGGTSLYKSLTKGVPSKKLAFIIAVPLLIVFVGLVTLNFWEILPFEQGERLIS